MNIDCCYSLIDVRYTKRAQPGLLLRPQETLSLLLDKIELNLVYPASFKQLFRV
jgi:hypothetical protein